MVGVPSAFEVARPPLPITARFVSEEVHVTVSVTFWLLLSVYVPVAVNCCVNPATTEGFAGVTAIETSLGAVTVSVVEPLTVPETAWIAVVPGERLVASPLALIVAAAVTEDPQVTVLVRFCVLPLV